jgi:lipid-A-disaccharide synthase
VRIFITAGEPSGDAHAARLMASIRSHIPDVLFEGFGGPAMQMEGLRTIAHLQDLAVTGFWEVAKRYGYFRSLLETCDDLLGVRKPDLYIPVDYPGFNMRLAARARHRNIPVAWYIAPQLWAWGKDRATKLANVVTTLLVVFPFEVDFFRQFGIDTYHVGHPLLDQIAEMPPMERGSSVLLLPGSRQNEVQRHVPLLRETVQRLQARGIEDVCVAQARNVTQQQLQPLLDVGVRIVDDSRRAMASSGAGLVKAGTSTLEAAVMGLPFATFYRTSWMSYELSKRLVTVDSITMANLLLHENVVHEYIQRRATPQSLANEVVDLLGNGPRRAQLADATQRVRDILGGPGASARAGAHIAKVFG